MSSITTQSSSVPSAIPSYTVSDESLIEMVISAEKRQRFQYILYYTTISTIILPSSSLMSTVALGLVGVMGGSVAHIMSPTSTVKL